MTPKLGVLINTLGHFASQLRQSFGRSRADPRLVDPRLAAKSNSLIKSGRTKLFSVISTERSDFKMVLFIAIIHLSVGESKVRRPHFNEIAGDVFTGRLSCVEFTV